MDKDGKIDFDEFVKMTKGEILNSNSMEENIKQMFYLFDENKDGFITLSEFNRAAGFVGIEKIDKKLWNDLLWEGGGDEANEKKITLDGKRWFKF